MDYIEFNMNQTRVGSPLKTYKGSRIGRAPKTGVGKLIGNQLYFHKDYARQVMSEEHYRLFQEVDSQCPFDYNCARITFADGNIALVECPDFDTAREPVVGRMFAIRGDDHTTWMTKFFNQIYHHKWLWVDNMYLGFDVAESWEWSRTWLCALTEKADGSNLANWESQLRRYNLQ